MNNSSALNIGLFGGAFDPVHIGHQHVAENLLNQNIVDEVWFVPVFKHPWAAKMGKEHLSSYEHRVEMLKLAIEDLASKYPSLKTKLKIKHFEDVSFTYDILEFFAKKHPEMKFHWIMGSEYLPKFDQFLADHPKLPDHHFYVYPRLGHAFKPMYPYMTALTEMDEVKASSTDVRNLVAAGQNIGGIVPASVAQYIAKHQLYL